GIWVEVTTLIIPGINDSKSELQEIAKFLAAIDKGIPWHISAYYPQYKSDIPPTSVEQIRIAIDIGKSAGLKYVYGGNIPGSSYENTYCPKCNSILIERFGFSVSNNKVKHNSCLNCGIVVAMSDSNGYIYDPEGLDLNEIKIIKEINNKRIIEYKNKYPNAKYNENSKEIWKIKCDIALPCATQNEINSEDAEILVNNGCYAVGEGANMPCTPEAVKIFLENRILYTPGKASNAGGVAVSALEMCQNSARTQWTAGEVDKKLKEIMS
ncbi:unnamed protein product, partial [marine sediment metagenome]